MKRSILSLGVIAMLAFFWQSCSEDEERPELNIGVEPLLVDKVPGDTVKYTINVSGALKSVNLNGAPVKTFSSGETESTFEYIYTFPENSNADAQIVFTAEDTYGETEDATVQVTYVKPPFVLAPFDNLQDVGPQWVGDWWFDGPYLGAKYGDGADTVLLVSRGDFGADMDHGGEWDFTPDMPQGENNGLMMSRAALRQDPSFLDTANWGGYMVPFFRYGKPLPGNEVLAALEGTARIFAVDVYFEETDSEHDFEKLKNFTTEDSWEYDPDLGMKQAIKNSDEGVKFQLRLFNYDTWKAFPSWGSEPEKYFAIKEAYLTAPNEWQTLYFIDDDPGEQQTDRGEASQMSANDIDGIWLSPVYAYPWVDENKIYLKNFRIATPGF